MDCSLLEALCHPRSKRFRIFKEKFRHKLILGSWICRQLRLFTGELNNKPLHRFLAHKIEELSSEPVPIPAQTPEQEKGWTHAWALTWASALLFAVDKKFGSPLPDFFYESLIRIQLLHQGTKEHCAPHCTPPGTFPWILPVKPQQRALPRENPSLWASADHVWRYFPVLIKSKECFI